MTTVLLIAIPLVLILVVWLMATANRLDRLHIRTDAAWAALEAALARRAVVARTVAATGAAPGALREIADHAEHAARPDREAAENELSRGLAAVERARLPLALVAELVDAEQRVVIARRVHNDAVRDTLAQRRRRTARWLKLAGTAPQPQYFEIAEPELNGEAAPVPRPSARVLLFDSEGRVLLFHGGNPADDDDTFWFTVGGGVEPDEDIRAAALRELHEETGIKLGDDELTGPVWRRRAVFSFDGRSYDAEEWFFVATTPTTTVDTSGFNQIELDTIDTHRWWSAADLRSTTDTVYPVQLAELLPDLLASTWDGRTRPVR
nr:NUDIX domain-containing protein [Kibdelosporangium sp. MJ126-NF4]CEL22807.1 FIG019327: membrane domain / Dihydroneopterin triphosphate pyrophosphohydolase, putative, Actinobacterial type, NudB-like [Kibdelosporangium sp. MJ126-NF4]CTQ89948.1 FIG019327: membrane domain / Dihydroneopterin triphosphate pyrophosphohydolase, putative, Actinobacterial type, NudB-like [Kibdelosporangium sp. MJ126-NF4]